jgi:hypothetical protein
MDILKHSKSIIYFEINSDLNIVKTNDKFKTIFPSMKDDRILPLEKLCENFPNPEKQLNILTNALSSDSKALQIQIDQEKKLQLEVVSKPQDIACFFGTIDQVQHIQESFFENWNAIQMSVDAIILGDLQGHIIYINPKVTEFTKYAADELIGQHISILFPEEEMNKKPLRFDLLNKSKEYLTQRVIRTKNGDKLHIEMLSKKVKNGYITNIRNIEERIKAENELEEIRNRHLFVAKLERIGIIDYNLTENTSIYNDQMCRILGYNDFQNCDNLEKWIEKIHPDDRERVTEGLKMVQHEGNTFEFVYRVQLPGKLKTIKASADILYSENSNAHKLIISSIDISDSNELKIKLQELEQTFHALSNSATSTIFIYREKFLYVNRSFERVTGYRMKEALNMNFWDIIHPDHRQIVESRGRKRISGASEISHYDFKIITKSGEVKWMEFAAAGIRYMGEYAAIGSAFDITQRKQLEIKLKDKLEELEKEKEKVIQSENRFKEYMLQHMAPMFAVDIQTKKITFANKAAETLYGYNTNEFKLLSIYNLQTLSKAEVDQKMQAAIQKTSSEFIFKHKRKDNSIVTVRAYASPVKIHGSLSMVIIINDISQELATKEKLLESHTTYKNILDSISEMLYILDKEGAFLYVNEAAVKNYQYPANEFKGKTPAFLSAPGKNNLEEVAANLKRAYDGEQNTIYFWGLRKDGSIFPKEVVLSPGYYFGEKVVLAVSRDISEHLQITEELTIAKEKAEESDQLKSAFLANMSHEIRTPMNAILGFSELIKDPEMESEERLKFIHIINRSSNHLLNLINDLVDMSKIYSNQMPLSKDKFSLNSIFFEIYEYFESELVRNEKNDHIKLTVSFGLPYGKDVIVSDETRLRQILNNLIGNAVKFTSKGKVHFEYKMRGEFLHFKVLDTGIGIQKEQIKNVFNRFIQADDTISKKFGGTGLGLAITQACVDLLGGEIWLDSEYGEGTQVYFKIPMHIPD